MGFSTGCPLAMRSLDELFEDAHDNREGTCGHCKQFLNHITHTTIIRWLAFLVALGMLSYALCCEWAIWR